MTVTLSMKLSTQITPIDDINLMHGSDRRIYGRRSIRSSANGTVSIWL